MWDLIRGWWRPYQRFVKQWKKYPNYLKELQHTQLLSFSQFGEDAYLWHLFDKKKNGFYVDVGAYDPFVFSNTNAFYRQGWNGILVEPNPEGAKKLREYRKRDVVVESAIDESADTVDFFNNGLISGIANENFKFSDKENIETIRVKAIPLRHILKEHLPLGREIDFLSIDCEGNDEAVLRSNDWDVYRPRVVLVEADSESFQSILDLMQGYGYIKRASLGITHILVEESFRGRCDF